MGDTINEMGIYTVIDHIKNSKPKSGSWSGAKWLLAGYTPGLIILLLEQTDAISSLTIWTQSYIGEEFLLSILVFCALFGNWTGLLLSGIDLYYDKQKLPAACSLLFNLIAGILAITWAFIIVGR